MRETRRSNLVPRVWVEPTLLHNDAVYEGEWVGKPDGRGVLLTPSFAYMGEWKNGVQHGFGVYICLVSKCRYALREGPECMRSSSMHFTVRILRMP